MAKKMNELETLQYWERVIIEILVFLVLVIDFLKFIKFIYMGG